MAFSPETYALLKAQGGGGGSFPTPTAADVGSALTVQKVPVQGAAIAPEQTVTYDEEYVAELTPAEGYEPLFVNGADVFAVVDGVSYYSRVVDTLFLEFGGGRFQMYVEDGRLLFFDDNGEATTVACYAADYAYEYGLDPYPGYDVVIDVKTGAFAMTSLSGVVLKGNLSATIAKMMNLEPIIYAVIGTYEYGDYYSDQFICSMYVPEGVTDYIVIADKQNSFKIYWTSSGITNVAP